VNGKVKFSLAKDNAKGAILVVENPVTKEWFESGETAFKRWIDDNVDALKSNWAKELGRGLWLIRSIISTKAAYISVLNSQKKELTIGGDVTVAGYGGGDASFTRKIAMKADGWEIHTSDPVSPQSVKTNDTLLSLHRARKESCSYLLIVMKRGRSGG
jgi:hypothetical protein